MPLKFKAKIMGAKKLADKQAQMISDLSYTAGGELVQTMQRALLMLVRDAKLNAPVSEGRLKNSIVPQLKKSGKKIRGIVGTVVDYAPYMEFGTGTFVGKKPHYPPPRKLRQWAARHGLNPYVVARAIYLKGGLEPRRYMQDAFDKNIPSIKVMLKDAVAKIVWKK